MANKKTLSPSKNYRLVSSSFRSKTAPIVVKVYVENDMDKMFWYPIFEKADNTKKYDIVVWQDNGRIYAEKSSLLSKFPLETLCSRCILAIDSDYDELIKNYSNYSDIILTNKYIITTEWYAMDNYKCQTELMQEYCRKLTLVPNFIFDYKSSIESISSSLGDLFITMLVSTSLKDNKYYMKDFRSDIDKIKLSCNGNSVSISNISYFTKRKQSYNNYLAANSTLVDSLKDKMRTDYSIMDTEYYRLYRGHDLVDLSCKMIAKKVEAARTSAIDKITNSTEGSKRKSDLKNNYYNSTGAYPKSYRNKPDIYSAAKHLIESNTSIQGWIYRSTLLTRIKAAVA